MYAMIIMAAENSDESDNLILLVRMYQNDLYNRAYRILKNREDSEDAVQQVFLSLVKNHSAPDAADPKSRAILYVSVDNKAKDIYTERKNRQVEELREYSIPAEGSSEKILIIKDAIARLPGDLRECLVLSFYCGYTTKEIADYQNIKRDTVQKRIKKAKDALREILAMEEVK